MAGQRRRATSARRGPRTRRVHEHPDHVGVVEQVAQLVLDVAVVDVDRDGPELEGGEHRLEVLGAVGQVDADVVAGPDALGSQVWASRFARSSSSA